MKQHRSVILRTLIVVLLTASPFVVAGFHLQTGDGIVWNTRKNGNGCVCHSFPRDMAIQVWISGPTTIRPGQTAMYTVHIAGGPTQGAGFNVAAAHGTLISVNPDTRLHHGELAQSTSKPFVDGRASWSFEYRAPSASGRDTMFSAALSSNKNSIPDAADRWNFGDDFVIQVSETSASVPLFSSEGIGILYVLLILSAAWFIHSRARLMPKDGGH